MAQFPTPAHLASWAGLCPGNNESAGKHKSTKTRSGNPWLTSALVEASWSAVRTRNCYLGVRFRRIAKRRGEQRALIAIAHTILIICWHLLIDETTYTELGTDYLAGKDQPDDGASSSSPSSSNSATTSNSPAPHSPPASPTAPVHRNFITPLRYRPRGDRARPHRGLRAAGVSRPGRSDHPGQGGHAAGPGHGHRAVQLRRARRPAHARRGARWSRWRPGQRHLRHRAAHRPTARRRPRRRTATAHQPGARLGGPSSAGHRSPPFRDVAGHQATEAAVAATYAELSRLTPAALAEIADDDWGGRVVDLHRRVSDLLRGTTTRMPWSTRARPHAELAAAASPLGHVIWHLPEPLSPARTALVARLLQLRPATVLAGLTGADDADRGVSTICRDAGATLAAPGGHADAPTADRVVSVSDADEEVREVVRSIIDLARRRRPRRPHRHLLPGSDPYVRSSSTTCAPPGSPPTDRVPTGWHSAQRRAPCCAALALPDEGWRRDPCPRWSPAGRSARRRTGPARRWERISREAGVVGGLDDWHRKLEGFADRAQRSAEAADNDGARGRHERNGEAARQLLAFVTGLDELVRAVTRAASWSDKVAASRSLARCPARQRPPAAALARRRARRPRSGGRRARPACRARRDRAPAQHRHVPPGARRRARCRPGAHRPIRRRRALRPAGQRRRPRPRRRVRPRVRRGPVPPGRRDDALLPERLREATGQLVTPDQAHGRRPAPHAARRAGRRARRAAHAHLPSRRPALQPQGAAVALAARHRGGPRGQAGVQHRLRRARRARRRRRRLVRRRPCTARRSLARRARPRRRRAAFVAAGGDAEPPARCPGAAVHRGPAGPPLDAASPSGTATSPASRSPVPPTGSPSLAHPAREVGGVRLPLLPRRRARPRRARRPRAGRQHHAARPGSAVHHVLERFIGEAIEAASAEPDEPWTRRSTGRLHVDRRRRVRRARGRRAHRATAVCWRFDRARPASPARPGAHRRRRASAPRQRARPDRASSCPSASTARPAVSSPSPTGARPRPRAGRPRRPHRRRRARRQRLQDAARAALRAGLDADDPVPGRHCCSSASTPRPRVARGYGGDAPSRALLDRRARRAGRRLRRGPPTSATRFADVLARHRRRHRGRRVPDGPGEVDTWTRQLRELPVLRLRRPRARSTAASGAEAKAERPRAGVSASASALPVAEQVRRMSIDAVRRRRPRPRITTSGLDETLFVEAGAGTGKTSQLVDRVVNLVVDGGVRAAPLAAITFTEAAASELRDRIRAALESRGRRRRRRRAARCREALADVDRAAISHAARLRPAASSASTRSTPACRRASRSPTRSPRSSPSRSAGSASSTRSTTTRTSELLLAPGRCRSPLEHRYARPGHAEGRRRRAQPELGPPRRADRRQPLPELTAPDLRRPRSRRSTPCRAVRTDCRRRRRRLRGAHRRACSPRARRDRRATTTRSASVARHRPQRGTRGSAGRSTGPAPSPTSGRSSTTSTPR